MSRRYVCKAEKPETATHSICKSCEDKNEHPRVGDAATYTIGVNKHPCTVTRVSESGKTIWICRDKVRGDLFLPAIDGEEECFGWDKTARRWHGYGSRCGHVCVGVRLYYHDPAV